jgi:NAD(P)-dependent dehydrogenase (short-subunit alcohol dehydrogenase family)
MSEFTDKNVIVTGGAKGIGAGITRAFAGEGARVACVDVDEVAGAAISTEGESLSGEIRFVSADASSGDACKELCEKVIADWGGIDVVCNNVGIQPVSSYLPAHELPDEMWDRILDVNLKSAFLMTKHSVPNMMARGGGVIINTASVQGLQSALGVSAYAASKGGMLSLTRQLSLEYAQHNIRVMAVNPGGIDTPLVDELVEAIGQDRAEFEKGYAKIHPIGRFGVPADIAHAVLFLASEKASFMTGSYMNVDGGLMAKGAWAAIEDELDE